MRYTGFAMKDLELIDALLRQAAALNDAYITVFPYRSEPEAKTFLTSAKRAYAIIVQEIRAAIKRLVNYPALKCGACRRRNRGLPHSGH